MTAVIVGLAAIVLLVLTIVALGMRSMSRRESALTPERIKAMAENKGPKPRRPEAFFESFPEDFDSLDDEGDRQKQSKSKQSSSSRKGAKSSGRQGRGAQRAGKPASRGRRGVDEWGEPDDYDDEYWTRMRADEGLDDGIAAKSHGLRDEPQRERTPGSADPNAATVVTPLPQRPVKAKDQGEPVRSAASIAEQKTMTFSAPPPESFAGAGTATDEPAGAYPSSAEPSRTPSSFATEPPAAASSSGTGTTTGPIGAGSTGPFGAVTGGPLQQPATGPASGSFETRDPLSGTGPQPADGAPSSARTARRRSRRSAARPTGGSPLETGRTGGSFDTARGTGPFETVSPTTPAASTPAGSHASGTSSGAFDAVRGTGAFESVSRTPGDPFTTGDGSAEPTGAPTSRPAGGSFDTWPAYGTSTAGTGPMPAYGASPGTTGPDVPPAGAAAGESRAPAEPTWSGDILDDPEPATGPWPRPDTYQTPAYGYSAGSTGDSSYGSPATGSSYEPPSGTTYEVSTGWATIDDADTIDRPSTATGPSPAVGPYQASYEIPSGPPQAAQPGYGASEGQQYGTGPQPAWPAQNTSGSWPSYQEVSGETPGPTARQGGHRKPDPDYPDYYR
ncbi:MAG: hypothetical protein C0P63_005850 [Actinomycetales bacterium]|nr:hypothetical protein [Thermobispora sp.]